MTTPKIVHIDNAILVCCDTDTETLWYNPVTWTPRFNFESKEWELAIHTPCCWTLLGKNSGENKRVSPEQAEHWINENGFTLTKELKDCLEDTRRTPSAAASDHHPLADYTSSGNEFVSVIVAPPGCGKWTPQGAVMRDPVHDDPLR